MSWAANHIEKLARGETIQIRPQGGSMVGRISPGQLVTIVPAFQTFANCGMTDIAEPEVGDVVLCKVNGTCYLHLVKAIGSDGRFQIGNNKGHINGWCLKTAVYGVVIRVED